ncbi:glycolipid 2-alpha-mannosyltransferase [Scheffersomyces xylosifermentans]|uniref:glycolipid 2-alpha-mannosyltransferase n=1 Tax=Scheffersomyces xylosifermentans TaxID=1304137 RepID=UPI00315C9EFB
MIRAFSFRLRRRILLLSPILAVIIFIFGFGTLSADHSYYNSEAISTSFKSLSDKFDFTYLQNFASGNGPYNRGNLKSATLDQVGYIVEPNNVDFKFINRRNLKGKPAEILKINEERYKEIFKKEITEPKDFDIDTIRPPKEGENYVLANATIIALVRNHESSMIGKSIRQFEKKFNSKFNYPYTFLNDQPFAESFKRRMAKYSNAPMEFVTISPELWNRPDFVDPERQKKEMEIMDKHNIAYAKKESYHNMCRFYSGNFYNVPELQKYRYYWRIEPDVKFYTNIKYDVFKYLEGTKKVYGFTINLYDIQETVKTLWPETLNFLNQKDNYKYVNVNGAHQWLLENLQNPQINKMTGGYSTCHFWSNFEIADMDFFRGEAYNEWFKYLDSTGKFYYERWGDAPIHSMGLALFADKKQIHWFRDIGYFHDPYYNCPRNPETQLCETSKFSKWEHLADQNCMVNYIDNVMDDLDAIY